MYEQRLEELLNRVTAIKYVNFYLSGDNLRKAKKAKKLVEEIIAKGEADDYYINVNIQDLSEFEEEAVKKLIKIINDELLKAQLKPWINEGISITDVLEQLNEPLEEPVLIIFHYFSDKYCDKEKNILRSIRKFIEMNGPGYLGILLISCDRIKEWELFPISNLDERHVEFFECL